MAMFGASIAWLLFERYQCPESAPFKLSTNLNKFFGLYIYTSPLILYSGVYLGYRDLSQATTGFILGVGLSTIAIVWIKRTLFECKTLKGGFYPLWIKLGLVDNLSPELKYLNDEKYYNKCRQMIQTKAKLDVYRRDLTKKVAEIKKYVDSMKQPQDLNQ